jgi:VWFA-related protein
MTRAVVLAAALSVAAVTSTLAQTFKSSVEAVRVDVLVTDRGNPVRGLRAGDFEVRDNGVVQPVNLVSFEETPLNVVMALDLSGSVEGERLRDLRRAGRALMGGLRRDDRAGLLTFSHVVTGRSGLSTDRAGILDALDVAEPSGETSLVDAAYAGLMMGESEGGRALVVLFSDGLDVSSWLTPQPVLDTARRVDAVVYAVSLRGSRPRFLEELTSVTGGRLIDVESKNLSETFLKVLNEFRERYVLSYSPEGVSRSGWHQLEVRVKGRKASVKARPGYVAGHF